MFIRASSTISFQPTFRNQGFSSRISELNDASVIIRPDYNAFISVMDRRRMSEVLKMAITCSLDCIEKANILQPDAIIVGTSMGCCSNTKSFLDKIIASNGSMLSPTAFILSTHNSIAGQISLILKNHNYNITHTQNSLSFEQALMDALICVQEEYENILIGASDELENELYNIEERLKMKVTNPGFGASFFIISPSKPPTTPVVEIVDVASLGLREEHIASIVNFLETNSLSAQDIDLVLYAHSDDRIVTELGRLFNANRLVDYQKYSGVYFTNSAFAMHFAIDHLTENKKDGLSHILICNNLIPENLGLILLRN